MRPTRPPLVGLRCRGNQPKLCAGDWGGKAVVVNEQPAGPLNDRDRVMPFRSMNSWFANRHTEIVGADGKIKSVTWAKAWHQHRDRRQYDGVEFFPNPDGAAGTPGLSEFVAWF